MPDLFTASLGSASITGNTPLGLFDSDTSFQTDGPKVARWIQLEMGWPTLQVELTDKQVYGAFELATEEYGSLVNTANTKNWITALMGSSTSSIITGKFPHQTYALLTRTMDQASKMAMVGGNYELKSGSITMSYMQQQYDLSSFCALESSSIEIMDVLHYAPAAINRVMDPSFGLFGAEIADTFGGDFGIVAAGGFPMYYMFPQTTTFLRAQSVELNDKIRRSQFSWKVINNNLWLYPPPNTYQDGNQVWFNYYVKQNPIASDDPYDTSVSGVMDISNMPYTEIPYSSMNRQAKTWIRKYTMAKSKEILGHVRSKYASVPIPRGEVTLDGQQLITDAKEEMQYLKEQLLADLEALSIEKLMEKEKNISDNMNAQSINISPLPIFMG